MKNFLIAMIWVTAIWSFLAYAETGGYILRIQAPDNQGSMTVLYTEYADPVMNREACIDQLKFAYDRVPANLVEHFIFTCKPL